MLGEANFGVADLERIAGKVAHGGIMPHEWITDPNDPRLADFPEWVPRPGETATIACMSDFYRPWLFPVDAVKADDENDGLYLIRQEDYVEAIHDWSIYCIGDRYVNPEHEYDSPPKLSPLEPPKEPRPPRPKRSGEILGP